MTNQDTIDRFCAVANIPEALLRWTLSTPMKLILRSIVFAAVWFVSVWLLADATGQALYLGSHGKEPGYYTEVELFLNLNAPTQWVRRTELGVGGVLFPGVLIAVIVQVIRWRRSQRGSPA